MAKKPLANNEDDDMDDVELPTVKAEPNSAGVQTKAPKDMQETVSIILEDNDDIPPTGLYVAMNGDGYRIPKGSPCRIPKFLKQVLDDATVSVPVTDPNTGQVIEWRNKQKYAYRMI
jgi:hypothetical protein